MSTIKISDLVSGNTEPKITEASGTVIEGNTVRVEKPGSPRKEKQPKAPKDKKVASGKFTSVLDLLTVHEGKEVNATQITVATKNVPTGKYLFYETADEHEVVQVHNPKELMILNSECERIIVNASGIIILAKTHRTYIMKTNVIQFALDEHGFPIARLSINKISEGDPSCKEYVPETKKYSKVDHIKVQLKNEAITLYNKIESFQKLETIKEEMLNFLGTKKDVLYLIKIENIMLETA